MRKLPRTIPILTVFLTGCIGQPPPDPLTPELRAKVEQLKIEVAASPTTQDNLFDRARLLWEFLHPLAWIF